MVVSAVRPLTTAWTVQVPSPVTLPDESRGTLNVIVTLPTPLDSALVTTGFSSAAVIRIANTMGPLFDGPVGLSSSQADAPNAASAIANIANRRMCFPP